ncbi:MAG: prolyl oligopeptidase family serine peptidase [Chthonomonas sp.]|nr:prolyl oligopeptidase family serine peptidase [Chthonomonas sp.]
MRAAIFVCLALLVSSTFASERGEALKRADSYGARVANKVLNENLTYGWTPGDQEFWFREDILGGTKQFWVINDKGDRKPAFDHAKVSKELGGSLPFARLKLSTDGKSWLVDSNPPRRIDRTSSQVSNAADTDFTGLRAFSPADVMTSEGAGPRVEIVFVNNSQEPLTCNWLDEGGEKRQYKVLAPGERWSCGTYEGHFWVITNKEGRALAVYKPEPGGIAYLDGKVVPPAPKPRPRDPALSPDGRRRIVFRGEKAFLIEVETKQETELTHPHAADTRYRGPVHWSLDSQSAAFECSDQDAQRPLNIVRTSPPGEIHPKLESRQYLKPGDKLANPEVVVWRNGEGLRAVPKTLYPNAWDLDNHQWLDANRLVFRYNQRGHQVMRLVEYDARTNQARTLFEDTSPTFIDWTNKTFFRVLNNRSEAIWMSERTGWAHLYLVDLATGKVKRPLTQGSWVVRSVERVDEDERELWFQASGNVPGDDPTNLQSYRVNLDTAVVTPLTEGPGNQRIWPSPEGKFALARITSPGQLPRYELRNLRTGRLLSKVVQATGVDLMRSGFRLPEVFSAKGRDGKTDIWGLIYRPTNFDPNKKYPVVEDIYAGPHGNHVPKDFHVNSGGQQIAEMGFIVVRIDAMGTNNRGKAFHDVCYKNIADAGFPDRIAWMRDVAKRVPQMDLTRVGIYGTSAGGQNALHALLLHGDFYKVAIADCGCYDNRVDKMWWNEQWMGYPVGPHYAAQSCATLAPKLQGKLMLLLGENDTNVDPASTWQVVDALVRANKDFDLIVLPNVGHGAIGHPYARRRAREFLWDNLIAPVASK